MAVTLAVVDLGTAPEQTPSKERWRLAIVGSAVASADAQPAVRPLNADGPQFSVPNFVPQRQDAMEVAGRLSNLGVND